MKTISCFLMLFCITFSIFLVQGCSKGEDEAQKAAPVPVATQTAVEQKADQPVEIDEPAPQKIEPVNTVEIQPTVQEVKKDLSEESNADISQKTESAEVTESTPITLDITEVIVIENQGYAADKKGPVKFSHLKHSKEYEVSCTQCHHVYKDGENQWKEGDKVEKCIACHDPLEDKDKAVKLQSAFHKNCRDCHTEVNKEGKKAPATKCTECHS